MNRRPECRSEQVHRVTERPIPFKKKDLKRRGIDCVANANTIEVTPQRIYPPLA